MLKGGLIHFWQFSRPKYLRYFTSFSLNVYLFRFLSNCIYFENKVIIEVCYPRKTFQQLCGEWKNTTTIVIATIQRTHLHNVPSLLMKHHRVQWSPRR